MTTSAVPPFNFQPYEYTSLPSSSSTRLLSLIDDNDCPSHATVCGMRLMQYTLTTVDLDDNLIYDALSYTWGSPFMNPIDPSEYRPTSRWPIAVNGKLFYITKNLFDALSQFRSGVAPSDVQKRYAPFNKTELIRAAEQGRIVDVEDQLEHGAAIDAKDCFGETALHYAAENGHVGIVKMLLRWGSDAALVDRSGRTPLDCCLERERGDWESVAEVLRDPVAFASTGAPGPASKTGILRCPLWIDAICINQDDILERNAQLAMMARIYSTAQKVIVWLGPKDDRSEVALDRILQHPKTGVKGHITWAHTDGHSRHQDVWTPDTGSEAVRELFSRTWFSRVWVIQELAFAASVRMMCGARQFDWITLLEHVLKNLGVFNDSHQFQHIYSTNLKSIIGSALRPCVLADAWIRGRIEASERRRLLRIFLKGTRCSTDPNVLTQLSLPVLLALTWEFEATDPRDKLFALLGLARLSVRQSITADYSRSVVDVYTEFARIFLEAQGNNKFQDTNTGKIDDVEPLEGLSFLQDTDLQEHPGCLTCQQLKRTPGLPSWVPDFKNKLITSLVFRKRFRAGADSPYRTYRSHERVFKLDGGFFDALAETEGSSEWSKRHRCPDCGVGLDMLMQLDANYPTGISRAEALWRTLLFDERGADEATFQKWLCGEFEVMGKSLGENAVDAGMPQPLGGAADPSRPLPAVPDSEVVAHRCPNPRWAYNSRARRLFRTEKGFLGLGPRSVRAGDQVWILAGARVPFVLRDVSAEHGEDSYQMIGEAYVHGIMQGEAVAAEGFHFDPVNLV